MAAFTQRQATPKKNSDYRGSVVRKFESSDEDDSSDQSDSDEEQSWKRQKTSKAFPKPAATRLPTRDSGLSRRREKPDASFKGRELQARASEGSSSSKRRRNNIWGSVVAEQNQEMVERELTHFGVEAGMERDVESYRQSQQLQLGTTLTDLPPASDTKRGRKLIREVGEDEDDAWLAEHSPGNSDEEEMKGQPRDDLREKLKKRGSMVADQFRRSHVKNRLGSRPDEPIQAIVMRPVEIDPSGEAKVVAGQLAYSLQEPKRDLLLRIVKVLGVEKSIEIWKKTEEIENDGGMLIRDRSRRRSPGGVFIQLMKTDPDITKEDIKLIFEEEKKVFEAGRKKRRRHTKKQAGHGMDVDHHGDQNTEETMDDGGDACVKKEQNDETEMSTEVDAPNGEQELMFAQNRVKQEDLDFAIKKEEISDMEDRVAVPQWECPDGKEEHEAPLHPNRLKQEHAGFAVIKEERSDSNVEDRVPIPQRECPDIKEENETMFFVPVDIPKRNPDSEPEDGEVIDDDDD